MTKTDQPTYAAPGADRVALSERFEAACNLAARLYSEGADTTDADADVERLAALLDG